MREIKFRVYVKSIVPEETGLYYPEYISWMKNGTNHDIDKVFTKDYKFKNDTCEFTLMQYTGLKDRHGREIYENDIVQNERQEEGILKDLEKTFVIKWGLIENCGDCFEDSGVGFNFKLEQSSDIEVIGNIYENKDLIK